MATYNPLVDNGVTLPLTNKSLYPTDTVTTFADGNMMNVPGTFGPTLLETGVGEESLQTIQGMRTTNIHDIAVSRSRERFPIKWMADLNTKQIDTTTHLFGEEWDGDYQFPDTFMNELRLRNATTLAIDDSSNVGGKFSWKTMGTGAVTAMNAMATAGTVGSVAEVVDNTRLQEVAMVDYNGKKCLPLAHKVGSSELFQGGHSIRVVQKIVQILHSEEYLIAGGNGTPIPLTQTGVADEWFMFNHGPKTFSAHMMFPDLGININGIEYQEHEVVARVEGFWYNKACTEFVLFVNFTTSNLRNNISSTTASNIVLLEEMINEGNKTALFTEPGIYTRMDRQFLLGMGENLVDGVEEGSGARMDGHTIFQDGESLKTNWVQIFRSKPLEITKTRLMTGDYKVDDIQRLRSAMMDKYNETKSNAGLRGVKEQLSGRNNKPIRKMSGLLDYTLNDIRYIRATLAMNTTNTSEAIRKWINNLAYTFSAFKEKSGSRVITFATSHEILERLSELVILSRAQEPNVNGTQAAMGKDPRTPRVDMSVAKFDFVSAYGVTIRFIHAPELDYMTSFTLPYFITGGENIKPRNIIMAVDKQYLSTLVLDATHLQSNIQGNDEHLIREDIIGAESQEVLYTKNHAVIIVDFV